MFNNEFLIFQKFAKYYLGTSERKKSEVGKCFGHYSNIDITLRIALFILVSIHHIR